MKYLLLTLLLVIAVAGCSSVQQQLDPNLFYKRDVLLQINGKDYSGVTVVPKATSYSVTIIPPGEIDLALVQTCHREFAIEKADSGWNPFGKKKKFTYQYTPVPGIEDSRVCPVRVSVFESEKGRNSWAFLEMENPAYTIDFAIDCDGTTTSFHGVGVCQNKAGTYQRVRFYEPVMFAPPMPGCNKPKEKDGVYEIIGAKGECLYSFKAEDGRLGRLTLISYDGVLVREAQ